MLVKNKTKTELVWVELMSTTSRISSKSVLGAKRDIGFQKG